MSAALRRDGLANEGDTVEVFRVSHLTGLRAAQYALEADVPWIETPAIVTAEPGATRIALHYHAAALAAPGLYVGTVTAHNPNDLLGGPLFRLVNAVVVPYDLHRSPVVEPRRSVEAGGVRRYFLRVRRARTSLAVTVTLPDSLNETAIVRLYEPGGRPFRDVDEVSLGDEDPGTARLVVRSEDLVPGVYELTIIAPPLDPATVVVRAEVSEAALAFTNGAVEVSNAGPATLEGRVEAELIGAERRVDVRGRGAPAESLSVQVPAWAEEAEIDFELPPERWERFTDFGLTVFDAGGQIVTKTPLNYAIARHHLPVAERRGSTLIVELFPAYAWPDRTPPWEARVTVRFLAERGVPQDARAARVVPGGRLRVPIRLGNALPTPVGFEPLVHVTLGVAERRGAIGAER
jgi:hypothetical protein